MDGMAKLQASRSGRRWLKKEVARRSICPFCGVSGKRMPEYGLGADRAFSQHIRKHLVRGDKQNPEYR